MKIGDVIASFRRKKRIDQKEMAKSLCISASYLSQIENNSRNASLKLLIEIAKYFDIPLSTLLFQVIEDSDITNLDKRNLFIQAKPMMDEMIAILLSEEAQ